MPGGARFLFAARSLRVRCAFALPYVISISPIGADDDIDQLISIRTYTLHCTMHIDRVQNQRPILSIIELHRANTARMIRLHHSHPGPCDKVSMVCMPPPLASMIISFRYSGGKVHTISRKGWSARGEDGGIDD